MKKILTFLALSIFSAQAFAADNTAVEAGTYQLDKTHASIIFRVNHLGLSRYPLRFKNFDAELKFDSAKPEAARVTATIDPTSIETDYPNPESHDFNAKIKSDKFLDAEKFPQIKFRSTKVELNGEDKARVYGKLTLHGITKEIVMDVVFNGGLQSVQMGKRIGFSAKGSFNRSDFGIAYGIPEKDSKMGVADNVDFEIEAEFLKK